MNGRGLSTTYTNRFGYPFLHRVLTGHISQKADVGQNRSKQGQFGSDSDQFSVRTGKSARSGFASASQEKGQGFGGESGNSELRTVVSGTL